MSQSRLFDVEVDSRHPFERAGLGQAPFRFIGATRGRSSCCYCGTAIATKFFVRSADGQTFHAGCDCIAKTDDPHLIRRANDAAARLRR